MIILGLFFSEISAFLIIQVNEFIFASLASIFWINLKSFENSITFALQLLIFISLIFFLNKDKIFKFNLSKLVSYIIIVICVDLWFQSIFGKNILSKPPSAELGPNQFDTDSLPPYSVLDDILKSMIEEKKDLELLLKEGHKKDLILDIISLLKKSEFKRKQAPPILKLSRQSFGSDWRVPIAISY